MNSLSFLFAAILYVATVLGQQYAGETIPNSLPSAAGAEKAFFNILDSSGHRTTLINHFSFPGGARQNKTMVQRAVIILHGANRDSNDYFTNIYDAVKAATAVDPTVNENTVAIMAPCFTNQADAGRGYPTRNGVSNTSILAWQGTGWYEGYTNIYPAAQKSVSSFDAMDQILQYFDDILQYPNMKQIVVAGHSMGAQMVLRYAAVGKVLLLRTPVVYWSGNPSSFVWLNNNRPVSTGQAAGCTTGDEWSTGVGNYTVDYEAAFVRSLGAAGVKARYDARNIAYGRGLNDHGDYSEGKCGPYTEGADRGERFYNFMRQFPPNSGDTVDYYAGVGHDAERMTAQPPGLYRLFFDNFNGNRSHHADFGARQVPGDDPFPA
ncbi:hypothetical protein BDZ89DRAFT_1141878 [Hymenopellis radicata]|nr:hypothetical protein BDZ89DRAFT_1141878 [Hymenopellis radicata]